MNRQTTAKASNGRWNLPSGSVCAAKKLSKSALATDTALDWLRSTFGA